MYTMVNEYLFNHLFEKLTTQHLQSLYLFSSTIKRRIVLSTYYQVDGAFDTEGTEESEGDGNSSSSSSDENSDKVDKDKDTDAEKQGIFSFHYRFKALLKLSELLVDQVSFLLISK